MQGFTLVNPQTGEAAVASEGQEDAMTAALEIVGAMEGHRPHGEDHHHQRGKNLRH